MQITQLTSTIHAAEARERRREDEMSGMKAQIDSLLNLGALPIPPCPGDALRSQSRPSQARKSRPEDVPDRTLVDESSEEDIDHYQYDFQISTSEEEIQEEKKTNWVMHEYEIHSKSSHGTHKQDEWVVCRVFQKSAGGKKYPSNNSSRVSVHVNPYTMEINPKTCMSSQMMQAEHNAFQLAMGRSGGT
ncbi:hypothetical protein RND71_042577 [Anisodus tanguticus]|uniref:NAC domain-containing protein n=1 Tax=Anisodus tanguticus TaxID=243964 RepID=A0AAE1QQX1_9SOLA|nr:hypothetical protein RND71_042577 [Anisodus tanguticus]